MTTRQFFLKRFRAERPAFVRVLQALPADKLDYKPHDRSPTAKQIAGTIIGGLTASLRTATEFRSEWHGMPELGRDELVAEYERLSRALDERVSAMSDAEWERVAEFYVGDKLVNQIPAGQFIWFLLFDAVHHRGQLTVYIRPMGGKVPSVYGPSGDSRAG